MSKFIVFMSFLNTCGYRKTFEIPEDWKEREVFLHFGAVKSALYVWLNGNRIGFSQGSKIPAEFNITPYLKAGKNTLFDVCVRIFGSRL